MKIETKTEAWNDNEKIRAILGQTQPTMRIILTSIIILATATNYKNITLITAITIMIIDLIIMRSYIKWKQKENTTKE